MGFDSIFNDDPGGLALPLGDFPDRSEGTSMSASSQTTTPVSQSSTRSPSSASGESTSRTSFIQCSWPSCPRVFHSIGDYNHHCKSHTLPFLCSETLCNARFATKRHLTRHANEKHNTAEKFYCKLEICSRSVNGGKFFKRKENLVRHERKMHRKGVRVSETPAEGRMGLQMR